MVAVMLAVSVLRVTALMFVLSMMTDGDGADQVLRSASDEVLSLL
jgi:hypothetical protein